MKCQHPNFSHSLSAQNFNWQALTFFTADLIFLLLFLNAQLFPERSLHRGKVCIFLRRYVPLWDVLTDGSHWRPNSTAVSLLNGKKLGDLNRSWEWDSNQWIYDRTDARVHCQIFCSSFWVYLVFLLTSFFLWVILTKPLRQPKQGSTFDVCSLFEELYKILCKVKMHFYVDKTMNFIFL